MYDMTGSFPMKYCCCKAKEHNWLLLSILESHLHKGREKKFAPNFKVLLKTEILASLCYAEPSSIPQDTQWLWCVPSPKPKVYRPVCMFVTAVHWGTYMYWAQEQTSWQVISEKEAREKPSLPGHQAVNPGMSLWPTYPLSPSSGWIRECSGWCKGKFIKVQDSECPGHIYHPHPSQSETHLERHMLWGEEFANSTNDKLES